MRLDCDIRLFNWICWHYWISATFERDENVISDYTTEFVDTVEYLGLLNEMRLWYQIIQLNLLTLLNKCDFWKRWECDIRLYNWICWHCWMCGTVEWDETVISDYTTEFVDTVEYVGLLNEILVWK